MTGPWTISIVDCGGFDIVEVGSEPGSCTNALLNGCFPTKAEALREVIRHAQDEQRLIRNKLARARRMLRAQEKAGR